MRRAAHLIHKKLNHSLGIILHVNGIQQLSEVQESGEILSLDSLNGVTVRALQTLEGGFHVLSVPSLANFRMIRKDTAKCLPCLRSDAHVGVAGGAD